jgi:uncharacterized protein
MAILTNLFGESPFGTLEAHGEKVNAAVRLLGDAFAAVHAGDQAKLRDLAERISRLETEADNVRNQLHEMVVSKVLLPLRKEEFLNILEHQDSMADRAEDIASTLTFRDMSLPPPLMTDVLNYLDEVLNNCELASGIMSKLDLLVEASFTGRDARTVSKLSTELAQREDAIKRVQVQLIRKLLAPEVLLPPVEAVLWFQVVSLLGELSKSADRIGNGIRMTLQLKQ